ncbi:MAG: histidine phosphatase family protein [Dehalococcoidia bacterium]|nr:histidine phosphatase family protein [Dehalococcoidia bacterium]
MKLILVRHGETHWNKERRIQGGSSDIELNDTGLRQAQRLASFLKNENIAAIISSPLKRAMATAKAIANHHQLPVEIDDELREIEVGELEGFGVSNLTTTFSQFLMQWWQDAGKEKLPKGESFVDVQQRSWKIVERLLAEHNNETVAVVSHYFVTLTIIFKALDLPLKYITKLRLDTGGVSILEFGGYGTRLVAFNNIPHQCHCEDEPKL